MDCWLDIAIETERDPNAGSTNDSARSVLSMSAPTAITMRQCKIFMPAGSKQPVVVHYIEHHAARRHSRRLLVEEP